MSNQKSADRTMVCSAYSSVTNLRTVVINESMNGASTCKIKVTKQFDPTVSGTVPYHNFPSEFKN